jgi:pimeloyl-ACP methyl ester carboxylesterase
MFSFEVTCCRGVPGECLQFCRAAGRYAPQWSPRRMLHLFRFMNMRIRETKVQHLSNVVDPPVTDDLTADLTAEPTGVSTGDSTGVGHRFVHRRPVEMPIGGRRLYGEWVEPAEPHPASEEAAPLVLLHEGLGSVRQWTNRDIDFPAEIVSRTGRRAFLYDRLGFGRSDALTAQRRPDYLHEESLKTLPAVLDCVGIDACIPVGHSDGANIALMLSAHCPDRVIGAVVEAPHVIVEERTVQGILAAKAAFNDPASRLRPALERYHGEKTPETFSGWADVWLTPEFAVYSMLDDLSAIKAPLLAIQGEDDEYATPLQLDLIAANVRGHLSTRLIPGCRHIPHLQAAEIVAPLIADFVSSLP